MLRKFIAFAFLALLPLSAFAWEVDPDWTDPLDGRPHVAAVTTNDLGLSLAIFRSGDESVRAVISFPSTSFDRFSEDGLFISLRPGQTQSRDFESSDDEDLAEVKPVSNGKSLKVRLWHGKKLAPKIGILVDTLQSDEVFARIYTISGSTIDTSWDMAGGYEAITEAVDLDMSVSEEEIDADYGRNLFLMKVETKCEEGSSCYHLMERCKEKFAADNNFPEFRVCASMFMN